MSVPDPQNPCLPQRSYRIGGISVDFPYKPYASQLAFMGKVVSALERSHRNGSDARPGHTTGCHALLESPTGTGKSLSLLCSALSWVKHFKASKGLGSASDPPGKKSPGNQVVSAASNRSVPDETNATMSEAEALVNGGGFIPEDFSTGGGFLPENAPATGENPASGNSQSLKKPKTPTIFYATRTHSQISQVLGEFRKTNYRVPMAVLAARKHYCTNKHVCKKKNIDEECKLLLKDAEKTCPQFKNFNKVKNHASLRKGGSHEIHDIEDLVTIAKSVRGCAYFASRSMASDAEIVFCPYVYLLNPVIRSAMEINIEGAIVILDEAHNIEDVAREAGSIDLDTTALEGLRTELEQLSSSDNGGDIYHPLLEMVQEILRWIYDKDTSMQKQEFEHYSSCWFGENALQELELAGVSSRNFQMLSDCAKKAIGAAADAEPDSIHLSGFSTGILEGLFSVLNYMLKDSCRNLLDYRVVLQKYVKRDPELGVSGWVSSLSFWCLNPAVVFEDVASKARSIILTSGTLSPIGSFASELGVQFDVCMEAPHVIDMQSQVFATSIAKGPGNMPLNASYKHADGYAFQDDLGTALEEIFKVSPDGALVFFPSYKLLDKLCDRWKSTGQWLRLSRVKQLFIEPRGKLETFEVILHEYYQTIDGKFKDVSKCNSRTDVKKKAKLQKSESHVGAKCQADNGAAFLAVCRGKVSEGIDFSDNYARVVIVVGIPFPNQKDLQVNMKKQYNTQNRLSKNLLSGDQWYCYQAFRALNQAVGRCIRHRHDYGAIILLDERYKRSGHLDYMSKWLRGSICQAESFHRSLTGLESFFQSFKVRPIKNVTISEREDGEHLKTTQENENINRVLEQPWSSQPSFYAGKCLEKNKCTGPAESQDRLPLEDISPKIESNFKREPVGSDSRLDMSRFKDISPKVETDFRDEQNISTWKDNSPLVKSRPRIQPVVPDSPLEYVTPVSSRVSLNSACFDTNEALSVRRSNEQSQLQWSTSASISSHCNQSAKPLDQICPQKNLPMTPCSSDVNNNLVSEMKTFSSNSIDKPVVTEDDPLVRSLSYEFLACSDINKSSNCEGSLGNMSGETKPQHQSETSSGNHSFPDTGPNEVYSRTVCYRCRTLLVKEEYACVHPKVSLKKKFLAGLVDDKRSGSSELTNLLVYDMSMLDTHVLGSSVHRSQTDKFSQGVWVEEDGCVYKPLFCPSCKFEHCIGACVLAANRLNMDLVDKVLLVADALKLYERGPGSSVQVPSSIVDVTVSDERWLQACSTKFLPKRENQTPVWSKLKLRRRE